MPHIPGSGGLQVWYNLDHLLDGRPVKIDFCNVFIFLIAFQMKRVT